MRTFNRKFFLSLVAISLSAGLTACANDEPTAKPAGAPVAVAPTRPADPHAGVFAASFTDAEGFRWCGYYDDYDSACTERGLTGVPIEIENPETDSDTGYYEVMAYTWFLNNYQLFDRDTWPSETERAEQLMLFAVWTKWAADHKLAKPAKKQAVRQPTKVSTTRTAATPPPAATPTRTATTTLAPAPRPSTKVVVPPAPTRVCVLRKNGVCKRYA